MTYVDSSRWQKSLAKLKPGVCAAFVLLLSACAADQTAPGGEHRSRNQSLAGKFEWGVQYFEAGKYREALKVFDRLRKNGAEVPEFDLIPYYSGMSHFRLGDFPLARQELEGFLQKASQREENQDARIALLLIYEQLSLWSLASSLAAETDKLTLFQNNRALLKLIWARALREQGEILGAKAALRDALPYLDRMGAEDATLMPHTDPNQDLWGRYHFTRLLIEQLACHAGGPKEIPPAKKKARARRLYTPWLESVADCYRKAVGTASEELLGKESQWAASTEVALHAGIQEFGARIQNYLKEESGRLEQYRMLQKEARQQLYRILGTVDEKLKTFEIRSLNPKHLDSLRKELDRLLVAISTPS